MPRKKLPKEQVRNRFLPNRVTQQELNEVKARAKACKMSVSDYVRMCCLGHEPKSALTAEEMDVLGVLSTAMSHVTNYSNALCALSNEEKLLLFHNQSLMIDWYMEVASITEAVKDFLHRIRNQNRLPANQDLKAKTNSD